VVLLWTALDYLPEPLVAPVVAHLRDAMNPGGQVLAFFHTRTQGAETAYCRYHITPGDDVDVQAAQNFPIQRAFTNAASSASLPVGRGTGNSWPGQRLRSHHHPVEEPQPIHHCAQEVP